MRKTRVTLDLQALQHNLQRVREAAPGCRVMAAIKANGYGHGLARVARALTSADAFGVACLDEAIALREAGIEQPITLLEGFFHHDELPLIQQHDLQVMLHHAHQIETLESTALAKPLPVWLKVDTGMHRLGIRPESVVAQWQRLLSMGEKLQLLGQMTHLACADDRADMLTNRQLDAFSAAVAELPGEKGIANSAGVLAWPQSHADWVRPGIMLYGASPFIGSTGAADGLLPVMTLHSELIAVNPMQKGDTIGYGAIWTCPEDMLVGVVAVGYGDGYPRHAPAGTPVLVNGHKVPLIGRVSMDMITVDLRGLAEAQIGDPVVLWGEGLPVETIAEAAGTIAYELLCGVTARVEAVELNAG